jgi:hypothetical protein
MQVIIDRFEGNYAVCEKENREMINIERAKLPPEAKEGDVLILDDDGGITIDREETARRKETIERLMDELWED